MDGRDIAYRIAGLLTIASSVWNLILSVGYFFSFIWFCVGVFWLLPGLLALGTLGAGLYMTILGPKNRLLGLAPLALPVIGLMNMNFCGFVIDLTAAVVGTLAYMHGPTDELDGAA